MKTFENETENENSFNGDVYFYMKEKECSLEEAKEVMYKFYKNNGWID